MSGTPQASTPTASTPASTLAALRRGDLAGARELRLNGLGLAALPPEVLGLGDTLEVLDLGDNALADLPAGFGRLRRLRVLFASGNRFARLPPVLGDCPALSQLGFRGTGLREVPGESLPPALRWLILTGNALESLPASLGERPALRKLMLAGNRLSGLPESLAGAPSLELLRLSANAFEALPGWLAEMPTLAWLAWAGNPLDASLRPGGATADWAALEPGPLLGEGTSGQVHRALWRGRPVALKLFKGALTSDGLPEREMAAALAAGEHPNLTGALARLAGHPEGRDGLLMPLLPPGWRVLAGPPSLATCSRDVYDPALRLTAAAVRALALGTARAAAHLHARGLLHGDLYAHNTLWDGMAGAAVLGDFGAASFLPPGGAGAALQRLEVRAWGLLLGELLDRCDTPLPGLRALEAACVRPDPAARPLMAEVLRALPDPLADPLADPLPGP